MRPGGGGSINARGPKTFWVYSPSRAVPPQRPGLELLRLFHSGGTRASRNLSRRQIGTCLLRLVLMLAVIIIPINNSGAWDAKW